MIIEETDMAGKRKPTHPGEILREDVIKPLNLTVTEAAKRLGITRKTLSALLNCRAGMSSEMALRVARSTGTTPESWLFCRRNLICGMQRIKILPSNHFKWK